MIVKLKELIQNKKLTAKEKEIADYIIENIQASCFLTSTELAKKLDVSYSSVIRFTKTLGFKGYSDYQNYLRTLYTSKIEKINESIVVPVERVDERIKKGTDFSIENAVSSNTLNNISGAIENNPPSLYNNACDIILKSNKRYIVSSRGTVSVGDFLSLVMRHIMPNVHNVVQHELNAFDSLSDIDDNDVIIAILYPRYSKLITLAIEMAHEQGAKIILITDKVSENHCKFADVIFTSKVESASFFNSYVAPMFIAETLCTHLTRRNNHSNKETLAKIDKYTSMIENF